MEKSVGKTVLLQGLKAGLFSLVFSCIGVLLLALFAKLFGIPDNILPFINQALKVIAVVLGTALSVKEEKFIVKALVGAVIFWVLSFLLFSVLGGGFHWGQIALDFGISVVVALIVAVIKTRRA